jgi:hypothetical protein
MITEKIRKYYSLSGDKRRLLTEAVFFLFAAKMALSFFPVKTVLRVSIFAKKTVSKPDMEILNKVKWALNNADRLALWKNRCLVKSIAGRWMLHRREIESNIFFGVRRDSNKKLVAHAWLRAGNVEVVEKGGDYLELTTI